MVIDQITRYTDDKEIAKTLVENIDGRDAGVCAGQNRSQRLLAVDQATSDICDMVGMMRSAGNKAFVSFQEAAQGLFAGQLLLW